ncbi:MAG: class I SAM-dependent methyltransferase [Bacteroidetes bacterium]|nr:MAG: class I SAM-dependent methyltransferase [Bacteroidota bacterium]
MKTEDISNKLIINANDESSAIKPNEALFIHDFIKGHNIKKTLEIGFAYARSASHIIQATQSKHIAIDPFQSNYDNLGLKNIENLGFSEFLDFRNDFSHNVLPKLAAENHKFEFVFIDGDHKFDGIFIDFYYSDLLINKNGFLMFHDTWMRSTRLVTSYIKKNRLDYKEIKVPLRNLQLFQKVGDDTRNGMFFKEFYTLRSILSHNLIIWMTTGKSNIFKKTLFKLKELVK